MDAKSFIASLPKKKLLVLTHLGADVDALCSAAAFYFAFRDRCSVTIAIPEHANLNAKAFAENLHIPYTHALKSISSFDFAVVVDLNSSSMLGGFGSMLENFGKPILLLDHHAKSGERIARRELTVINEDAVSTTELVYRLFKKNRIPVSGNVAKCIAAGIVSDSAGFIVADSGTFRIMAEMLEKSKVDYLGLLSLFDVKSDLSEKVARLKAARRCRIYGSGGCIIVSTDVGAWEATAATSLVKMGADVAFAGDAEKGRIRLSARANNHFVGKTGFDLVKHVFTPLEQEFGGNGGGHPAAAGYNSSGDDIFPLLKKCVLLTHKFISGLKGGRNRKEGLKEYP